MSDPYRIFLLEDSVAQARLMELAIEGHDDLQLVASADRLGSALDALMDLEVDVILTDLMVPDSSGLDTVRAIKSARPTTAVVVVSSSESPDMLQGAMRIGAQDFLIKGGAVKGDEIARVVRNAIERERMADAVRQSERRFRELLEQASDAIFVTHADGRFVEVNEQASRLTGYEPIELLSRGFADLFGTVPGAGVDDAGWDRGDAEPTMETFVRDASGNQIPVEVSARRLADGGVLAIARDIRERKRSEARMRMLESVVVHAKDAVMVTDSGSDGGPPEVLYVNDAFLQMMGDAPEDVVGQSPWMLHATESDPETLKMVRTAFERQQATEVELARERSGGTRQWIALSIVPVFAAHGRCTHFTAIHRDVTDAKLGQRLSEAHRDVLERIVRHTDLWESMDAIVELIRDQLPGAEPFITEKTGDRLVYLHAGNLPEEYVAATEHTSLRHGTTASCLAVRSGQPVYRADIGVELRAQGLVDASFFERTSSCLAIPIFAGEGAVAGSVSAFCATGVPPTDREAAVLKLAAQLAAVALDHHRLIGKLERQALHDMLTGLPNRTLLEDRLETALAASERDGTQVAVFFIDLDNFKKVNDTLGHHIGDVLLQRIAERLSACMRRKDTVARVGGDEFAVVLGDIEDPKAIGAVASKILQEFEQPMQLEDRELYVTTTIGVSVYPRDGEDRNQLLRRADLAMYRAKQTGQSSFRFFSSEMTGVVHDRLALEADLRNAIAADALELHYQEIVRLSDHVGMGAEALLRWNHLERGWVGPGHFIPLVENTGLIVPVGRWVLTTACVEIARRRELGLEPTRIAVNMSARQFGRPDFVATVTEAVERYGLRPGELEVEVTESAVMADLDLVAGRLAELRSLGVRISIDDFGTGYSSLSYLQKLPLDVIKIDREFIGALARNERGSQALVDAVITLAHGLGAEALAEGIEDASTLERLRAMGCDLGQGYFLGRPVPGRERMKQKPRERV